MKGIVLDSSLRFQLERRTAPSLQASGGYGPLEDDDEEDMQDGRPFFATLYYRYLLCSS